MYLYYLCKQHVFQYCDLNKISFSFSWVFASPAVSMGKTPKVAACKASSSAAAGPSSTSDGTCSPARSSNRSECVRLFVIIIIILKTIVRYYVFIFIRVFSRRELLRCLQLHWVGTLFFRQTLQFSVTPILLKKKKSWYKKSWPVPSFCL